MYLLIEFDIILCTNTTDVYVVKLSIFVFDRSSITLILRKSFYASKSIAYLPFFSIFNSSMKIKDPNSFVYQQFILTCSGKWEFKLNFSQIAKSSNTTCWQIYPFSYWIVMFHLLDVNILYYVSRMLIQFYQFCF